MLKVLTRKESFARLEALFAKMEPHDVLDLAVDDIRFAAAVVSVDRLARTFEVVPLMRDDVKNLLAGRPPKRLTVRLPSSDENPKTVSWNRVPSR